jgi:CheY-like chemotaxis protein
MKRVRILWVDDEVELLKPFIIFLKDKGYDVESVSNGSDAIEMVINQKFDLILLDEMMPGMDGLTTLQEIRKINTAIPIVMVTKSEEEGLMDRAIASQIADYLIKPINPNQIIMAIKKIFDADEIRQNQIGQEYAQFSAKINRTIMMDPDQNDWKNIYNELCQWDSRIDDLNDEALKHMHFLEKKNCNTEFCNFVTESYQDWLESDERPSMSYDLFADYILPETESGNPVYFILLDCMRLDQFLAIKPFIQELFDVNLDIYYSILPTATPYSRNSIFSGMLPLDISKNYPEYWVDASENENSRNRNEHQLLDKLISDLGYNFNPSSKYVKIFNMEEGNFVLRKIESWKKEKLIVLVYNFLDLLTHHRSKNQILQETIPDEEALRAFTKHWFMHSSLYEALKLISKQNATVVFSTDHGSIRVNRATQVVGDKDTTTTVRYKEGRNLSCNKRHTMQARKPQDYGLPTRNIVDNFIFAREDYYFVYPNSYHQYQKQYNGTFQHGGISMEEMLLPIAVCKTKK